MMKPKKSIAIISLALALLFTASNSAFAYWVWTPATKKFINPKYAVKDSPKEQFDWAMSFYDAKDYQRAAAEFEKLVKNYEFSEYAAKSQYYVGLSYENMNKYYFAFQNYQKTIDNFPHIDNIDEIIARQYNIANIYLSKDSPRLLGTDIMTSLDRSIEIYKKVVENAPFGKLADEAQFKMGEALKKQERYEEAMTAFQKIMDDYPNSKLLEKARYEVAFCAYKASLKPAYDVGSTDKAIEAFKDFSETNKDQKLAEEASKTMQRLKDKAAEKIFMTADFYDRQGHPQSAIVYYEEVIKRYPDSSPAKDAAARIEKIKAGSKEKKKGAKKWFGIL